ncbi:sulfatase-like hydrolase/transferase [Halomicroarcula limicola]|uniref:Sulfatase-like hydrolase/transferase n=1 Tax=Haloarcula limicola TaxID=1429915 RepID=A0A8J7Y7U2_9EURY|nr:sulfatase-like hydrolase/transferase [Halomicroarcula limicola]MBV0925847.1 sulfatase-like hydrolase/transferase [Halomicroarcula limicola]
MPRHDTPDDVLLLLTDQERYDVATPTGPPVDTAALDRLSADGVRFTHAYTPISICSSARASLLTGRYPHNHGLLNNVHEQDAIQTDLSTSIPTFGTLLRDAGYNNSYLGKWHVGRDATPADFGFDYMGASDAHDGHLEKGLRSHREELGVDPDDIELEDALYNRHGDGEEALISARTSIPVEATRSYYIAERTIDRLEGAAEEDDPFFHRSDFVGPHHPYVVPEPYASKYDPDDIERWPSYQETFAGKPQVQENYLEYRGVDHLTWDEWAEAVSMYFGFVDLIDDQIGRILDAVDEYGLRDDLLVVHASDHGDFTGNHRQFNKGPLMYEDTYRIPLVMRGPGVEAGRECDALVSLMDLMPTFLDSAGVAEPDGVDARSLWPLLDDPENGRREAIFAEYHGDEMGLYSQRMVRTRRYKYVFNAPDVDELYDLERDPHELQNLVDHPEYESERDRLRGLLDEWMTETDDPIQKWTSRHLESDAADRSP